MKMPRKLFSIVFSAVLLLVCSAKGIWAQKVYDLGHYPGGTWAAAFGISNSGVVVGYGDIAGGYTRPIGVPLFGPKAGQWFNLGTFGGEGENMCMAIADTGMIVGHAVTAGGDVHAFAWTPKSGMVDIGTLGGNPFSLAYGVNKAGTLIVGLSGSGWFTEDTDPVVWRPKVVQTPDGPTTTWNIEKLDTTGFEGDTYWVGVGVNNLGQIVGGAWDDSVGAEIAVLWNPAPDGKGWNIVKLPFPSDYPNSVVDNINDRGKIVGAVVSPYWDTALPALWEKTSPGGNTWNLTVLPTLSGSPQGWNEALGINRVGDIVGVSNDADWNWFSARWSTQDPTFVQPLAFPAALEPGAWSVAAKVNDNGIAAGWYGNNTIPEDMFAVQLH